MSLRGWPSILGQEKIFFCAVVVISFILSFAASSRALVNPDGICYLMSAEEIGRSGLHSAINLCAQSHWVFFAILIHGLAVITPFSYLFSANLLNATFTAISTLMFILVVKAAGGNKRTLVLAAGVILLSHEFNAVREYIVRDHGFWTFYLISVWFFIRLLQAPQLLFAACWYLSLVIATLFRIEGAVFILFLPFAVFLQSKLSWQQRAQLFLKLNLPTIIFALLVGIYLLFYSTKSSIGLGRIAEVAQQLQHGFSIIFERYAAAKSKLAMYVLPHESSVKAGSILTVMMFAWYVTSVITNLSWGYAILVAYAWFKKVIKLDTHWVPIAAYLIVNILITGCFLWERFFLSKRYLIALSLILMLWVPFALNDLLNRRREWNKRFAFGVVTIFILISAVGGIFDFGYSKSYIYDAGNWLTKNIPQKARLYANDYQLMYYSNHFGNNLFKYLPVSLDTLAQGNWKKYDYLALRLTKKASQHDVAVFEELKAAPIKTFQNKRGDKVLIYHLNESNKAMGLEK